MQAYSDPKREDDPHALPDIEIFYRSAAEISEYADLNGEHDCNNPWCNGDGELLGEGWYWWSCSPGCLPDSDPMGPFDTASEALADAQEGLEELEDSDNA